MIISFSSRVFQVKQAIKFLDDLGTVQYFDNDFLRDKVVINPQWIVNVMACVVSVKQSPIQVILSQPPNQIPDKL